MKDIPPNFATLGIEVCLERFRRILRTHPEFSERLSDYDRSILWRSNYQMAAALILLKVINRSNGLIIFYNNYNLKALSPIIFMHRTSFSFIYSVNLQKMVEKRLCIL